MFTPRSTAGLLVARFLSIDFAIATCLGLWHLLGIGTCATGGPFEIATTCTDTATTWALVFGAGLTGSIIVSFFAGFAWGWAMMFVPTGATALAFALVGDPGAGTGGTAAAWIIGPVFLLMGAPVAVYAVREALTGDDTSPDQSTRRNAEHFMRTTGMLQPFAAATGGVPQITVAPPATAQPSQAQQLARLDALKATGALTDTEYTAQRRALGAS